MDKPKNRRIVSWSQEEDDILRNQIRLHGTESWSIIASKFKDKTTRQCRRRWYTYLNSDFKKGGWSPEEDMLLCEAQKMYGNRWTEIAKVVSGRTDNAVKNRFTTLCKKAAKSEVMSKENNTFYMNQNNKRVLLQNRSSRISIPETTPPLKKTRNHVSDFIDNSNNVEISPKDCGAVRNKQLRFPLSVLEQNSSGAVNISSHHNSNTKEMFTDETNKVQGTFLRKDDPRILALLQQAELLSSLAIKVNTENTDQSLEHAWKVIILNKVTALMLERIKVVLRSNDVKFRKVLQDYLNQAKGTDILDCGISDMDFELEDFKDLIEDLRSSNEGSQTCWRPHEFQEESGSSSEYSTGSTFVIPGTAGDKMEEGIPGEKCAIYQDSMAESQQNYIGTQNVIGDCENGILSGSSTIQDISKPCDGMKDQDQDIVALPSTEFGSPLQVMPMFGPLASGIPSPKFSESERQFLMKALGMESPSCHLSNFVSQPPPCKRSLLQSL